MENKIPAKRSGPLVFQGEHYSDTSTGILIDESIAGSFETSYKLTEVRGKSSASDKNEPELGVTKCECFQTEIQVSKDPLTGKIRAEKVKKN